MMVSTGKGIGFVEGALPIDARHKFALLYIFNVQHNMKMCVKAIGFLMEELMGISRAK